MNHDWHDLIQRYIAGTLSDEEALALQNALKSDEDLRALYLDYMNLDVALGSHAESRAAVNEILASPMAGETSRSAHWLSWRPLAAAAAAVLMSLAWWLMPSSPSQLGTITQVMNVESSGEGAGLAVGQGLKAGRVMLNRGAMEIRLSNGVTLLCEGPGELELLSPMRALLHSGQVVVRVPQNAIGFQMDAASARVVDLGTEFAMKAGPGLETDVQVFEGVVEASPARGGFASRLEAGRAARYTPGTSVPKELAYSESRFLRKIPIESGVPMPGKRDNDFRPARHAEVVISSVNKEVVVDGDLSEWSAEGRFFSELDAARSVEGRMRHDADAFYLAAHIADPAPMRNSIDPGMDGEMGWRGGGLQVRLSLDRALGWPVEANSPTYYSERKLSATPEQIARAANARLVTLTLWHHAPSARDCLHLAYGFDYADGVVNPPGYTAAFKRDADGAGYTIEARVPWSLLRVENDPPRAGDALAVCWHAHWSDPSGRVWRTNLVELRNPSEPLRIYDFERAATWGRAIYR